MKYRCSDLINQHRCIFLANRLEHLDQNDVISSRYTSHFFIDECISEVANISSYDDTIIHLNVKDR